MNYRKTPIPPDHIAATDLTKEDNHRILSHRSRVYPLMVRLRYDNGLSSMECPHPHVRPRLCHVTCDWCFEKAVRQWSRSSVSRKETRDIWQLDRLLGILVQHEIVPVLQPIFMGFGWKGMSVAGPVLPPAEYARYCRYLVARYGARPVIYLVGGDGSGYEPQVPAGGEQIER